MLPQSEITRQHSHQRNNHRRFFHFQKNEFPDVAHFSVQKLLDFSFDKEGLRVFVRFAAVPASYCIIIPARYLSFMKAASLARGTRVFLLGLFAGWTAVSSIHADQIAMQNGDHYSGKVIALDDHNVVLQSEILGTLRLSRDKVTTISFGTNESTNAAPNKIPKGPSVARLSAPVAGQPNPTLNLNASSLRQQIAANSNLVSKVQTEVLAGAGPKAAKKYDELISGLSTGNLNIADLRREAASVAEQLRQLRGSEDDETGGIFDEYLSVLDSFLQETKTATGPATTPQVGKPDKKPLNSSNTSQIPTTSTPEDE